MQHRPEHRRAVVDGGMSTALHLLGMLVGLGMKSDSDWSRRSSRICHQARRRVQSRFSLAKCSRLLENPCIPFQIRWLLHFRSGKPIFSEIRYSRMREMGPNRERGVRAGTGIGIRAACGRWTGRWIFLTVIAAGRRPDAPRSRRGWGWRLDRASGAAGDAGARGRGRRRRHPRPGMSG